jgi:hypothetical protein
VDAGIEGVGDNVCHPDLGHPVPQGLDDVLGHIMGEWPQLLLLVDFFEEGVAFRLAYVHWDDQAVAVADPEVHNADALRYPDRVHLDLYVLLEGGVLPLLIAVALLVSPGMDAALHKAAGGRQPGPCPRSAVCRGQPLKPCGIAGVCPEPCGGTAQLSHSKEASGRPGRK